MGRVEWRERIPKDFYYLAVAETIAKRSTCIHKQYGAVIVKDDNIISTGYTGSPRGYGNCCDRNACFKDEYTGHKLDFICRAVHAECNAIIAASREQMRHATMYVYGYDRETKQLDNPVNSCSMCRRMIINAGIDTVIYADANIGLYSDSAPYRARVVQTITWIMDEEELNPDCIDGGGY